MIEVTPSHPHLGYHGRWHRSSEGTVTAHWCSASVQFLCTSSRLCIRAGANTQRKDAFNGGTLMLAWTISEHDTGKIIDSRTADAEPLKELVLIDGGDTPVPGPQCVLCVELVLIDWASVFELKAVCVDSEDSIQPLPPSIPQEVRVLIIGDSISCGYAAPIDESGAPIDESGAPIPRGYCDAFPYVAMNQLRRSGHNVRVDTVAYPGVTLTRMESCLSMQDIFHKVSPTPWDTSLDQLPERPSVVVIALGTNDEGGEVDHDHFLSSLEEFIKHLCKVYRDTVTDICIIPPFPYFSDDESDSESSLATSVTQKQWGNVQTQAPLPPIHVLHVVDGLVGPAGHATDGTDNATHMDDGLHPTVEGHQILGLNFAERLGDVLGKHSSK